MPAAAETFIKLIAVPALTVLLAYRAGNNGFEAFIAICLGLGAFFTIQLGQTIQSLYKGKHWLITKILITLLPIAMWLGGFIVCITTITASGHDPRLSVPHINWWVAGVMGTAYMLSCYLGNPKPKDFSYALLYMTATFYALVILQIASFSFYSDMHGVGDIVLVLAGQLQYIVLYLVIQKHYVEWAVAFGQSRLGSSAAIDDEKSGPYILLAGLPFFVPLLIILFVAMR